ncbi:MAG: hypothetical protein ACXVEU_19810, partial [Nocardioidaceae bacterium]
MTSSAAAGAAADPAKPAKHLAVVTGLGWPDGGSDTSAEAPSSASVGRSTGLGWPEAERENQRYPQNPQVRPQTRSGLPDPSVSRETLRASPVSTDDVPRETSTADQAPPEENVVTQPPPEQTTSTTAPTDPTSQSTSQPT